MKFFIQLIICVSCCIICTNCSDETLKDTIKPSIDFSNGFPTNCSEITRGEPFTFKAIFNDNNALGSYSIDIHNNFDHHNHSTEEQLVECDLEPKKKATNPFKLIETYKIEGDVKTFNAEKTFTIAKSYQAGNYHFHLKVTDKEGWTTIKGFSIYIK